MSTEQDSLEAIKNELHLLNENIEDILGGKNIKEHEKEITGKLENFKHRIEHLKGKESHEKQKLLLQCKIMEKAFKRAAKYAGKEQSEEDLTQLASDIEAGAEKTEDDRKFESIACTMPLLSYFFEILKITESHLEKAKIYCKIGEYYHLKAKDKIHLHRLDSLQTWQYARNNYQTALSLDPKNLTAAMGFAKCMNRLQKNNAVIEFLKNYNEEERKHMQDYYITMAIAHRKALKYEEAKKYLDKDRTTDEKKRDEIEKERKFIEQLEKNTAALKLESYKQHKNVTVKENHDRRTNKSKPYRILSVDGGGIRGIIPGIWLSELEKRIHKPISHAFNLLAGTSTGGIIAAGLSCPLNNDGYTPKYRAYDILDIYLNRGANIFQKKFLGLNLFHSTYSEKGRQKLFEEFFGRKRIKNALTDLVIPAANEESLFTTYLFNRHDAREDPFRNDTYVDALMATSAAPTYFPSHYIEGKGLFNDGGVQVNNPAAFALTEARKYNVPFDDIHILSIGTGTYVPEPVKQNPLRGLFFWAVHLQEVALEAQVGNADIGLWNSFKEPNAKLGREKYQRWQAWFENPITLDDYGEKNINFLVETANYGIEEADASDANILNNLVEQLLEE